MQNARNRFRIPRPTWPTPPDGWQITRLVLQSYDSDPKTIESSHVCSEGPAPGSPSLLPEDGIASALRELEEQARGLALGR